MTPNNYSYNRDEHYCYPPDYRVLVNRFDIRKQEALDEIEREIVGLKLLEIQAHPIPGCFDLFHLKTIHRHLFKEIYAWAGEVRKGSFLQKNETLFCLGQHIESFAAEIHRQLKAEKYLCGLDKCELIDRLAYYMGEINALHPFREGNGRTQRVYFHQLAMEAGYNLDFNQIPHEELLAADIAAFDQNYALLKAILGRSLYPIS